MSRALESTITNICFDWLLGCWNRLCNMEKSQHIATKLYDCVATCMRRSNDSSCHLWSMLGLGCCPINYHKLLKPYWGVSIISGCHQYTQQERIEQRATCHHVHMKKLYYPTTKCSKCLLHDDLAKTLHWDLQINEYKASKESSIPNYTTTNSQWYTNKGHSSVVVACHKEPLAAAATRTTNTFSYTNTQCFPASNVLEDLSKICL